MDTSIDNNQFEIKPIKSKRKIVAPCPNVYLNPALDLLANEDPMCNNAMEIIPVKKRKRTRSCEIAAFENTGLDIGISKAAVNEFLKRELDNVRKYVKPFASADPIGQSRVETFSRSDFLAMKADLVEHTSSANDVGLPLSENTPSYDIVGLPTTVEDMTNYYDTVYSGENFETIETVQSNPTSKLEAKVVAIVEPRMNVSEPIYANVTDLNILTKNTEPRLVENTNDVVACSSKYTETVGNQNEMEISNIDDSNFIDVDSEISEIKPKSICPQFGQDIDLSAINKTGVQTNITNQVFINNSGNINLSFIDRLAIDSPNINQSSLCLDDDLNESNIMEIKTITIITKKKRFTDKKKITNPFLDPNLTQELNSDAVNPFLNIEKQGPKNEDTKQEIEYSEEIINRPVMPLPQANPLMPRRLFTDNNSTVSTINESSMNPEQNEYENIDGYRSESPVYENVGDLRPNYEKQSRILGCDVSHFSALDIMNINRNKSNSSNESNDSKKDFKHQILKASKLKKVFKSLKKTFTHDKVDKSTFNATSNPYEVPRKLPKTKTPKNESGIENPALKLDISDETEDEDLDEEHQYESIKTLRNTRLNMNVTPLKERHEENIDTSHNRTNTPGKKVRFDSTLNQEKVITGNSFDYGIQSPGFDSKIDKYHDELENCINEKKFLQQNM